MTSKLNDFYVDVVGIQLRQIKFPFQFYRNKLNAAVQDKRNLEENYRKEKNAQSRAALILANTTNAST